MIRSRRFHATRFWVLLGLILGMTMEGFHVIQAQEPMNSIFFRGVCDGSCGVSLEDGRVLVGNDETNIIRLYSMLPGGESFPEQAFDLNQIFSGLETGEMDLEGATRQGDLTYWIGSHSRNKKGKKQETRQVLFSLQVLQLPEGKIALQPVGRIYSDLVKDLDRAPEMRDFNFKAAAKRDPNEVGSLDIEALASGEEGQLWIGFRSPNPHGSGLLIEMKNGNEVLSRGVRPVWGEIVELDMKGYGFRALEGIQGEFFGVAGPWDGKGDSFVFHWKPGKKGVRFLMGMPKLNPEAIVMKSIPEGWELVVLSDDGNRNLGGVDCNEVPAGVLQGFRAQKWRIRRELVQP